MIEDTLAWAILALVLSTRWFSSSVIRDRLYFARWVLTVILVIQVITDGG